MYGVSCVCFEQRRLESSTVIANHVSLRLNEVDIVVIRLNLEVLLQEGRKFLGNVRINVLIQPTKTHQINLSTRDIDSSPQHSLISNARNSYVTKK